MPTYEYACQSCDHEFEQFQSMLAEPLTKCPACGKKRLKRLVGMGAGLIFKGTGFYITDYKKKSGGEPKADGGEAKSSEVAKSSVAAKTGGESKSAGESKPAPAKPAPPPPSPKASSSSAKS